MYIGGVPDVHNCNAQYAEHDARRVIGFRTPAQRSADAGSIEALERR